MNGIDWCAQAIQGPVPVYHPGQGYGGWANGGGTRDPIAQAVGIVNAIDPATGGLVWRVQTPALPLGALVATGGGVVVAGELNGDVALLDATTGRSSPPSTWASRSAAASSRTWPAASSAWPWPPGSPRATTARRARRRSRCWGCRRRG